MHPCLPPIDRFPNADCVPTRLPTRLSGERCKTRIYVLRRLRKGFLKSVSVGAKCRTARCAGQHEPRPRTCFAGVLALNKGIFRGPDIESGIARTVTWLLPADPPRRSPSPYAHAVDPGNRLLCVRSRGHGNIRRCGTRQCARVQAIQGVSPGSRTGDPTRSDPRASACRASSAQDVSHLGASPSILAQERSRARTIVSRNHGDTRSTTRLFSWRPP